MSRVGKLPVVIPQGVEVTITDNTITAKGSKGELQMSFEPKFVTIVQTEDQIVVTRQSDSKTARARHGLYRSLAANLLDGVANGFEKTLTIKGVGYRVAQKGNALEFNLGYSHSITFPVPESLTVTFAEKDPNTFTISGADKQLVGQTAANIRELRKPEPYKGKGIRYADEHVQLKAGKSAAA